MLGIDAAVEPSRNRGHRARPALVGISRSHHGRLGRRTRLERSIASSRKKKANIWWSSRAQFQPAEGGVYCTIGGHSALEIAETVCRNAAATIAVGACAFDGGLVRSKPNPTGALGVQEAVPGIKVINMAGCPHNPVNTAAVLVHYLTFNDLPALDQYNRPLFAYGRDHSRSVRAARALRRRPFRHRVGRRRAPQRVVPIQNGLQGSGGNIQLSDRAVERSHQLADSRRTTAASPAPRRAFGTTCRRSMTACLRSRLRRRGYRGRTRIGTHRCRGGRRHRARSHQDDQARAETAG